MARCISLLKYFIIYFQFVLEDDRLNQSEALYTFLNPSSEYLKQGEPKKNKFSFSTLFKRYEINYNRIH